MSSTVNNKVPEVINTSFGTEPSSFVNIYQTSMRTPLNVIEPHKDSTYMNWFAKPLAALNLVLVDLSNTLVNGDAL